MTVAKIRAAAIKILVEYMGIGAEFVVDDAMDLVKKTITFERDPKFFEMYFFVCLGKLLPPEVPYDKVKEATLKALKA
jgi:hypothetical protein